MTIFGHSYAGILAALESELGRARAPRESHRPSLAALQRRFDRLTARYLSADDNPRYQKDPSLYAAFNARMNVSIRRLFQAHCVFSSRQVAVVSEEMVKYRSRSRRAA